VALRDMV